MYSGWYVDDLNSRHRACPERGGIVIYLHVLSKAVSVDIRVCINVMERGGGEGWCDGCRNEQKRVRKHLVNNGCQQSIMRQIVKTFCWNPARCYCSGVFGE